MWDDDGPDLDDELYTQCLLVKGHTQQVSWLPEQFAVINDVLKLKDEHGIWMDGWVVKEVWTTMVGHRIDSLNRCFRSRVRKRHK